MAAPPGPLWRVVRDALTEKGKTVNDDHRPLSVRKASRLLASAEPQQTQESWKRTLNRALDEDKPYAPQQDTAEALSRFFGKPADYFIRPQQRETQRERDLREENERLLAESAELRQRLEESQRASGGSGSA